MNINNFILQKFIIITLLLLFQHLYHHWQVQFQQYQLMYHYHHWQLQFQQYQLMYHQHHYLLHHHQTMSLDQAHSKQRLKNSEPYHQHQHRYLTRRYSLFVDASCHSDVSIMLNPKVNEPMVRGCCLIWLSLFIPI